MAGTYIFSYRSSDSGPKGIITKQVRSGTTKRDWERPFLGRFIRDPRTVILSTFIEGAPNGRQQPHATATAPFRPSFWPAFSGSGSGTYGKSCGTVGCSSRRPAVRHRLRPIDQFLCCAPSKALAWLRPQRAWTSVWKLSKPRL